MTIRSINDLRLLDSIEVPDGLIIEIASDPDEFFARKVTLNKSSHHWFGSAMRQGKRLQFVTTMAITDYLAIVDVEQAQRGASVSDLAEKPNRPKIPSQHKAIKEYLLETACVGEKWLFPNFMVNYGVGWTDEMPKARLTLLVTDLETLAWPAIFEPPHGHKMPSTDGGHRTGSLKEIYEKDKPQGVEAMMANGVGVTFVMESINDDRHQDFADCGKSRGIAKSVKATWDKRNLVVRAAKALVLGNPFLHDYVDATSPSVNLSSNSVRIWSMSAVRGSLVNALCASHEAFDKLDKTNKERLLEGAPERIGAFIDALVDTVPILQQLKKVAGADGKSAATATPAIFRKDERGCVLMRGAGFAVLMRAFYQAELRGMTLSAMAQLLKDIDWFVLKPGAPKGDVAPEHVYSYLTTNANPAWFKLVAVNPGDGSWRLKGTNDNLDNAWAVLAKDMFLAAAAE